MFQNGSDAGSFDEAIFSNNFPIHKNCRDGNVQSVSSMLSSQPLLALSEDSFRNWNPLQWAAFSGRLDCVRHVASVEPRTIYTQSSKTFQTPLHTAAEGGHPFVVLWLLQAGTNPKVKDIFGETALHKAARVGNAECVSLLMEVADNIGSQNLSGQTASAVAQLSGFPDIARFISQHEEASLNTFQSRQILPIPRMSRKRMRDAVCDEDVCKRRRPDEVVATDTSEVMDSMTASRYEHDNLCNVDFGYRNILYEVMLSEYHGC